MMDANVDLGQDRWSCSAPRARLVWATKKRGLEQSREREAKNRKIECKKSNHERRREDGGNEGEDESRRESGGR